MPRWICPVPDCTIFALAPATRPVHAIAPNPAFQAKDPSCPIHYTDLIWTPDPQTAAPTGGTVTQGTNQIHTMYGIQVGSLNGTTAIYCDLHQRKHVYLGRWPGDTPTDKPVFRSGVYDQQNLGLGFFLVAKVPWTMLNTRGGGVDIIFDCGQTAVGTEGETYILMQGGFQGSLITFHMYPVERDAKRSGTFRRCEESNLLFTVDVSRFA